MFNRDSYRDQFSTMPPSPSFVCLRGLLMFEVANVPDWRHYKQICYDIIPLCGEVTAPIRLSPSDAFGFGLESMLFKLKTNSGANINNGYFFGEDSGLITSTIFFQEPSACFFQMVTLL